MWAYRLPIQLLILTNRRLIDRFICRAIVSPSSSYSLQMEVDWYEKVCSGHSENTINLSANLPILLQGQSGFFTDLDIHPGVLLFKELVAKHGCKHFRPRSEDWWRSIFQCVRTKLFSTSSVADPECLYQISDQNFSIPDPGSKTSQIRVSKKHRIPDPDPQHGLQVIP